MIVDGKLPFLDVLVDNKNTFTTSVYHKPTFTGLLTNFRSFIPLGYIIRLIKTLLDRIYKINNTGKGFNENVKLCINYLSRNLFPKSVIDRNIKEYLDKSVIDRNIKEYLDKSVIDRNIKEYLDKKLKKGEKRTKIDTIQYFKLPFIDDFSTTTNLYKRCCKEGSEFRLVFSTTKVRKYFSTKDSLPECIQSQVVYLFKHIGCNACYVGRTHTHLTTRIAQHFDKESSVFNHLNNNCSCKEKCNKQNCFKILDDGNSTYQLAIKEGLHINTIKCY